MRKGSRSGSGARRTVRHLAITGAVGAFGLASTLSGGPPSGDAATLRGEAVQVGQGTARAYVELRNGRPVEIVVALSEAVLSGLPGHHSPGGISFADGHRTWEYLVALPQGHGTPYKTVVLNWNPGGHEPPGIYDLPHFDVHFYTVDDAARRAIVPSDPHFEEKAARYPAADFVPAGYVSPAPVGLPRMGVHWVDPTSPELNGATFTETFIFGSWDGEMIFAEPMFTKAFLESRPRVEKALPKAAKYATPGFRPTGYRILWDEASREYRVALAGLVER